MSDRNMRVCSDSMADIQTGPFGSQLHSSDYVDDGTPIITVEHLISCLAASAMTVSRE